MVAGRDDKVALSVLVQKVDSSEARMGFEEEIDAAWNILLAVSLARCYEGLWGE